MSLWLNSFLHNYIDLIPVELRLSYPNTETSLSGQSYNYFAQAVEEESNGTIKVTVYPAGSLAANTDILDAIQQGNVDIGHFVATYVSPTIKELTPPLKSQELVLAINTWN